VPSANEASSAHDGYIKPIRRVVTGNDAQGRSCVLFDSAAPMFMPARTKKGTSMTDLWVFETARRISAARAMTKPTFNFEPPKTGGHCRVVQSRRQAGRL